MVSPSAKLMISAKEQAWNSISKKYLCLKIGTRKVGESSKQAQTSNWTNCSSNRVSAAFWVILGSDWHVSSTSDLQFVSIWFRTAGTPDQPIHSGILFPNQSHMNETRRNHDHWRSLYTYLRSKIHCLFHMYLSLLILILSLCCSDKRPFVR